MLLHWLLGRETLVLEIKENHVIKRTQDFHVFQAVSAVARSITLCRTPGMIIIRLVSPTLAFQDSLDAKSPEAERLMNGAGTHSSEFGRL